MLIHSYKKSLHNNCNRVETPIRYTDNSENKLDALLTVAGNVLFVQSLLAEFKKMIQLSKEAKKIKKQYIKIMNYINTELHEDYREFYSQQVKTIYADYMRSSEKGNLGGIHILHTYIPQRKSIH